MNELRFQIHTVMLLCERCSELSTHSFLVCLVKQLYLLVTDFLSNLKKLYRGKRKITRVSIISKSEEAQKRKVRLLLKAIQCASTGLSLYSKIWKQTRAPSEVEWINYGTSKQ